MKYTQGTRSKTVDYEKGLIKYWQQKDTFNKSVTQRPDNNTFVFYDGPPFLTGTPHHGHLLISAVKDAVGRYQTMKGKRVERRWGWDCHGLPAEVFVEKQLGIKNKKEIGTKISISDYVNACRAAMVKTGTEWEDIIDRIGRWVEFKGAYKTMDPEYMESVWWAFKELYEKGSVYEGEKVLVYCTKDATPISKSEVAMENSYQTITDPSVYVYFKLEGGSEHVLAWTTTPWTLPANVALAVNPNLSYSLVKFQGMLVYVATDALERVFTDAKKNKLKYSVVKNIKGKELVGRSYHPLFENHGPSAHKVLSAKFVTAKEGTGLVHEAPAYGEEDYELCKSEGVPIVSMVDENGHYTQGRWQGENIWDVNKQIAKTLVEEGKALKIEYIQHEYPHCHRCGTKLMYRAHPSWFMDIQGQKTDMLKQNSKTNWVPGHLKTGRFKHIIESAPDWNLSRDRYWATPLPVWKGKKNDGTEVVRVFGSYAEFEKMTGKTLADYHLPNVMDVEFELEGVTMQHTGKVLDCWFESGSMPFAQFHYPFENEALFAKSFPADFIVEAIDQTRGWFYSLMAVNVGLFGKSPFKNLVCTGFIYASDGKKMSKKLKNYTDPNELMDQYGADSLRLLLLSSPLLNGEDFSLTDKSVADVSRKLNMIWNMYDFFTMYADVDGWEWKNELTDPVEFSKNTLDIWVASRIHQLNKEVDECMAKYNIPGAVKPILEFIDDASNWYIRRSRKRFWKTQNDTDKDNAYRTLHYVLVILAKIVAPFTPFLSEEMYIKLTGRESVHLEDWPKAGKVNQTVIKQMKKTRAVVERGLGLRMQKTDIEEPVKLRQPLSLLSYTGEKLAPDYESIIAEEVNVKQVKHGHPEDMAFQIHLSKDLTPELKSEGLAREIIRHVQNSRKKAGLSVDDRIVLDLSTADEELSKAISNHKDTIMSETLAKALTSVNNGFEMPTKIDGMELTVKLKKS